MLWFSVIHDPKNFISPFNTLSTLVSESRRCSYTACTETSPILFYFILHGYWTKETLDSEKKQGWTFGRAQPLAQATKQSGEHKSRITYPGLARTVFIHNNIQEIFFKINTTFHFLLEKNLHRPNKPKACHSEMSITPGLYFLKQVCKQAKWPLLRWLLHEGWNWTKWYLWSLNTPCHPLSHKTRQNGSFPHSSFPHPWPKGKPVRFEVEEVLLNINHFSFSQTWWNFRVFGYL